MCCSRSVFCSLYCFYLLKPSVHRRCWLVGRKGIQPVKTEWWGAGVLICLDRGTDLHMAQLMPLPLTVSCFSKIHIGGTIPVKSRFLVPAHLGSPGQRDVKRVCVRVCDRTSGRCARSRREDYVGMEDRWLYCAGNDRNRHLCRHRLRRLLQVTTDFTQTLVLDSGVTKGGAEGHLLSGVTVQNCLTKSIST